jgi:hypothetical protein
LIELVEPFEAVHSQAERGQRGGDVAPRPTCDDVGGHADVMEAREARLDRGRLRTGNGVANMAHPEGLDERHDPADVIVARARIAQMDIDADGVGKRARGDRWRRRRTPSRREGEQENRHADRRNHDGHGDRGSRAQPIEQVDRNSASAR